jgi:hypothetical protein
MYTKSSMDAEDAKKTEPSFQKKVTGEKPEVHAHPAGLFNDTFPDVQGVVKEVRSRPPHVGAVKAIDAHS